MEFCAFAVGSGNVNFTRNIFDRALEAVRLHVTRGREIWEAYREFEVLQLGVLMKEKGDKDDAFSAELSKKVRFIDVLKIRF